MAVYNVGCVEAKLSMDTEKDLITITRNTRTGIKLPEVTEIKLSDVNGIEHQYLTYGIVSKGSGCLKFLYPGCPPGGDMILGATTNENMVQYKASHKEEMDAFLAALKPLVDANKARNS